MDQWKKLISEKQNVDTDKKHFKKRDYWECPRRSFRRRRKWRRTTKKIRKPPETNPYPWLQTKEKTKLRKLRARETSQSISQLSEERWEKKVPQSFTSLFSFLFLRQGIFWWLPCSDSFIIFLSSSNIWTITDLHWRTTSSLFHTRSLVT